MTDFRPIALCNVIYKLVSKVMVNRLKLIFPDIISHEQSVVLQNTLILDNIIVTFETLHTIKIRKKGKYRAMAINLDMSKAYERVEWSFLQGMMTKLGLKEEWIR